MLWVLQCEEICLSVISSARLTKVWVFWMTTDERVMAILSFLYIEFIRFSKPQQLKNHFPLCSLALSCFFSDQQFLEITPLIELPLTVKCIDQGKIQLTWIVNT